MCVAENTTRSRDPGALDGSRAASVLRQVKRSAGVGGGEQKREWG